MEDDVRPDNIERWLHDAKAELDDGMTPRKLPVVLEVAAEEIKRLKASIPEIQRDAFHDGATYVAEDAAAEAWRRYPEPHHD